jgi:hypothetical protein
VEKCNRELLDDRKMECKAVDILVVLNYILNINYSLHSSHVKLRWYCNTCHYSICEQCCDRHGAHSKHDFVLCRTIANDLKSEVSAKYLEVADSKKQPIINALKTLEAMLFDIGVEGVPMFGNAKPNHVNSWQRAVDKVRAHYAAIRHLAIDTEEKFVKEIAELAEAKSYAVMDHIKALHADLDEAANCCDAKEAMVASPDLEACASHSDVMALLNDLEAYMASIEINMDSCIPVTVCTSDVLRVLEKSCHVGGPSTPGEVLVEVVENQIGFRVSWNMSKEHEGKPEVSSYVMEVKIVHLLKT